MQVKIIACRVGHKRVDAVCNINEVSVCFERKRPEKHGCAEHGYYRQQNSQNNGNNCKKLYSDAAEA